MHDAPESVPTVPRCLPVLPAGHFNGGQTEFLRFVTLELQGLLEMHREQQQDQLYHLRLQLHRDFETERQQHQKHHRELLQLLQQQQLKDHQDLLQQLRSQMKTQFPEAHSEVVAVSAKEATISNDAWDQDHAGVFSWTTPRRKVTQRRASVVAVPSKGAIIEWFMVPPSFTRKISGQTTLEIFVKSRLFLMLSSSLMIGNSLYVGWYANFSVENELSRIERGFSEERPWIGNTIFNVLLALEVFLRFFGMGWKKYFSKTVFWNVLDLILVILPVFFIRQGRDSVARLSFWRILRVFRFIHTAPLFRLPFFAHLRMITNALLKSLPAFLWAVIFGCLFLYMAGAGFCLGLAHDLQDRQLQLGDLSPARPYFSNLAEAMKHLYMALTNGIDWIQIYTAIRHCDPMMSVSLLAFSIFMVFAVVNIISAMFIERAFNVIRDDRDFWVVEEARRRNEHHQRIFGLFDEMDKDGSEDITWEEFERAFENPHVEAYLSFVDLDATNLHDIFQLLDKDKNGSIDINELLEGLEILKGPAKRVEVLRLYQLLRDLLMSRRDFFPPVQSASPRQSSPVLSACQERSKRS